MRQVRTASAWGSPHCLAFFCTLVLSASLCGVAAAEEGKGPQNVVRLNRYNFEDNIKNGKWFVKFFAPWCTHCQKIAPIWEKLADLAANKEWPAKVAEVDCTSNKDICEKYQVKGYPTLLWIEGTKRVRYTDVAKQIGSSEKKGGGAPSAATESSTKEV